MNTPTEAQVNFPFVPKTAYVIEFPGSKWVQTGGADSLRIVNSRQEATPFSSMTAATLALIRCNLESLAKVEPFAR